MIIVDNGLLIESNHCEFVLKNDNLPRLHELFHGPVADMCHLADVLVFCLVDVIDLGRGADEEF